MQGIIPNIQVESARLAGHAICTVIIMHGLMYVSDNIPTCICVPLADLEVDPSPNH